MVDNSSSTNSSTQPTSSETPSVAAPIPAATPAPATSTSSPSTKEKGFFSKVGTWLKDGVSKGRSIITPIAGKVGEKIQTEAGKLETKIQEGAGKVGTKLQTTADKITSKIPGGEHASQVTSNAVEKSVNTIGDKTKDMVASVKEKVNPPKETAPAAGEEKKTSLLGEISEKVHETAKGGIGAVGGVVQKAGEKIGSGVTKVEDMTHKGVEKVEDMTHKGVEKVEEKVEKAATTVKTEAKNVVEKAKEKIETKPTENAPVSPTPTPEAPHA